MLAQQQINREAAKADITVQQLRGNISVLTGSGGNIAVLTGPEGKLLVDAGIAVSRPKIQAALDSISHASRVTFMRKVDIANYAITSPHTVREDI